MAYVISSETGMDIERVIWNLPMPMVFKLGTAISRRNSDRHTMSRHELIVTRGLYNEIEENMRCQETNSEQG